MSNDFLVFISNTDYLDLIPKVLYTTSLLVSKYFPLLTDLYLCYIHSDSLIKLQLSITFNHFYWVLHLVLSINA